MTCSIGECGRRVEKVSPEQSLRLVYPHQLFEEQLAPAPAPGAPSGARLSGFTQERAGHLDQARPWLSP